MLLPNSRLKKKKKKSINTIEITQVIVSTFSHIIVIIHYDKCAFYKAAAGPSARRSGLFYFIHAACFRQNPAKKKPRKLRKSADWICTESLSFRKVQILLPVPLSALRWRVIKQVVVISKK